MAWGEAAAEQYEKDRPSKTWMDDRRWGMDPADIAAVVKSQVPSQLHVFVDFQLSLPAMPIRPKTFKGRTPAARARHDERCAQYRLGRARERMAKV